MEVQDRLKHEPIGWTENLRKIDLAADVRDLLMKVLDQDPATRLGHDGALSVMQHHWFKDVDFTWLQHSDFDLPGFDLKEPHLNPAPAERILDDPPFDGDPQDGLFETF